MSDQSRRSRPLGAAAAPKAASPAIAVVIALLAAVLGFFILKKLDGNDSASGTKPPAVTTGTGVTTADGEPQDSGASGVTPAPVTLPPPPPPTPGSYTVIVANGSGTPGSAKAMSTLLGVQGTKMGGATNILDTLPKFETSKVYFVAGNDAQGAAVAKLLGCAFVAEPMPATPPVDPTALVDVQVLIVQGKDLATSVLSPCADGATPAPAAPAVDPAAAAPVISTP
jgi:LytR cell envelope-related transcriptional attenuator